MAKTRERNLARKLRRQGESIRDITKIVKSSKSSVSVWCRDIELTKKQIEELNKKLKKAGYAGRLKGSTQQHEQRMERMKNQEAKGLKIIGSLSRRDFLIAGIALYWGEGNRKSRQVRVCNSDPDIIRFLMKWFRDILEIKEDRFSLYIIINGSHKNRIKEIVDYWSRITNIPKDQFTKTTFIKSKNKKNYDDYPVYYGTLNIRIRRSTELQNLIFGLIKGLTGAGE